MDIVIGRTAYINKDAGRENTPQYYGPGKKKRAKGARANGTGVKVCATE